MSIDFIIRTKLDNSGIVQTEKELRALFERGAKMHSQGTTLETDSFRGLFDPNALDRGNAALQESISLIRQAKEEAKAAGRTALGQGDLARAAGMEKVAAGYDRQLAALNKLKPSMQQFASLQDVINRNADKFNGAKSLQDYQKALAAVQVSLRQQAEAQLKSGNMIGFEDSRAAINQVEAYKNSLKSLGQEEENLTGITQIMNSKFNQFGFTLFITISTIKQVIDIAKQMFDTFLEGAQVADRVQSFAFALGTVGLSATEMRTNLRDASQGIVDLDTAMRGTLQMIKAGLPDAANSSDELLRIATNAAIVSGEVEQADHIYQSLIRGIIRGTPLLIDNADILIKIGDANEAYAESLGKSADELTVYERKMATLNAVLAEGDRINDLAAGFDSTAVPLKALESSLTDATNSLKLFFGVLASGVAEDIGETSSVIRDVFIQTLVDAGIMTEQSANTMRGAWGSFGDFLATLLAALASSLGAFFEVVRNGVRGLVEMLKFPIAVAGIAAQVASGTLTAAEAVDQLKLSLYNVAAANNEFRDSVVSGGGFVERMDGWMERFGISTGRASTEVKGLTQDLEEMQKAAQKEQLENQLSAIEKSIDAAIEARSGIEAQRTKRLADAREDYAERILDIEENLGEKLADVSKKYNERLLKISEDFKERAADLAKETAKELAEIDEDLATELTESRNQAEADREQAAIDKNKNLEDIAEDHQKKLAEIERKYQLDRMKALIDRDARALFEADQNRKADIAGAIEDAQEKKDEELEQYEERVEEINKIEQEQRQELIKNAQERREDALKAQAEQLADLKESYNKQRREAKKAYLEQRQEAISSAREQRQEAQEAHREQLADIAEWYRDQLAAQKERQMKEKLSELRHLNEMGELTQNHLNELKGMHSEYNKFVASGGSSGGNISYNPSTGGIGGSVGGIGSGGQVGGWQPPGTKPGMEIIQVPIPGKQRVDLNITNDKTLEQIFKEMSYEATIEVMNG